MSGAKRASLGENTDLREQSGPALGDLRFYLDGSGSAQSSGCESTSLIALIASALPFWISLSRSIFGAKPSCFLRIILPGSAKDA